MLIPRYTNLPTVRASTGLGQFAPPPSQPLPDAGQLVIQCLDRRGIPEDARTPLVTLLCAADALRPLIAEMQTRIEMFSRWVGAFEAGTANPRIGDREADRRYRQTRERVVKQATVASSKASSLAHQLTTALAGVDARVREFVAYQGKLDALWAQLNGPNPPADPNFREELTQLQNDRSKWRLAFYQEAALPLLMLAIEFVGIVRHLSALSSEAIKQDAKWMATIDGFLNQTIEALRRAEGKSESLLAKLSKLILGKDPFGTVLAGVVLVGIGLAAVFILPPLFRGLGERFEAKSKAPKKLND